MTSSNFLRVEVVDATVLHDLRRRVLRGGDPIVNVKDPRDHEDSSLHFAGFLGDRVVAAGSFYPSTFSQNSDLNTYQLRYLATDFDVQGRGFGALLMRAAETRLCSRGAEQLWANGRDTALSFYRKTGWQIVESSEHLSPETQLPHTVIFKVLRSMEPWSVEWAVVDDAEELASLREEMHFAISLRDHGANWLDAARRYFEEGLGDGSLIVSVARTHSGTVVSSAAASLRTVPPSPRFPQGRVAYVHSVSTRPSFRRRGMSRALMTALVDRLREREIERVELHAADDGEMIYRSLGFENRGGGPELRLNLREAAID